MTNESMLRFFSAWATHLNRTQSAGALVGLQPNGNLVLSIKNKLFQPFICICSVKNNGALTLRLSHGYDFGQTIKDIVNNRSTGGEYDDHLFSTVEINGDLANDAVFLSQIIASSANGFFSHSQYYWEKISPFDLSLVA